jgi:hypothetical protein
MSPQTSGLWLWSGSWTLIEAPSERSSASVTTFTVVADRPSTTSVRFAQIRGLLHVGSSLHGREAVVAPLHRARLALLDAGHEIAIEVPHQLAAIVEAFLAGLHAGAGRDADVLGAARVAAP